MKKTLKILFVLMFLGCGYNKTNEVVLPYETDTIKMQTESDSIDAYMKHWYEVLDTNSDGEIDGDYNMDHDSIIEWLEE